MVRRRTHPVNKPSRRQTGEVGGAVRGQTMSDDGSALHFQSFQQNRLLLRLLRDRTIHRIVTQPHAVEWLAPDGTRHRHVPQFVIERDDGTIEIHEVVSTVRNGDGDRRASERAEALRLYCEQQDLKYMSHEEDSLPEGAELANLQALIMFRSRCHFNAIVADATWKLLHSVAGGPVLIGVLVDRLAADLALDTGVIVGTLGYLLWHSELETNLRRLLFFDGTLTPLATVKLPASAEREGTFK